MAGFQGGEDVPEPPRHVQPLADEGAGVGVDRAGGVILRDALEELVQAVAPGRLVGVAAHEGPGGGDEGVALGGAGGIDGAVELGQAQAASPFVSLGDPVGVEVVYDHAARVIVVDGDFLNGIGLDLIHTQHDRAGRGAGVLNVGQQHHREDPQGEGTHDMYVRLHEISLKRRLIAAPRRERVAHSARARRGGLLYREWSVF